MKKLLALLSLVGVAAVGYSFAPLDDDDDAAAARDAAVVAEQLPSYPLDTCVVSGEELGSMGDPIEYVHEGRLLRLCCAGCKRGVEGNAEALVAKVDAAVIAAQKPTYPLTTCVVGGKELGEVESPVDVVHGTRYVQLCCGRCKQAFEADPAPFLAKVDAALIEQQLATYPMDTCLVSNEPLDSMGEPIDHLYGVTLVRFCCGGCKKGFLARPNAFLPALAEARAHAHEEHAHEHDEG